MLLLSVISRETVDGASLTRPQPWALYAVALPHIVLGLWQKQKSLIFSGSMLAAAAIWLRDGELVQEVALVDRGYYAVHLAVLVLLLYAYLSESALGDILRSCAMILLPVAALGIVYLALYLRLMRAGMAEVWRLDFIRAAEAKGLPRRRIVLNHVARNALLPLITMLGLQSASMLGGSVVIESVFAIPGLGRLASEAVASRDTPLLLGIVLVSALTVILINLAVDIAYALLDPRIRY